MTLNAKQMAGHHRELLRSSSPSLRRTKSLQLPSLHFLLAVTAIVGTGNRPRGALAEVPPELSSIADKPCAPSCQGGCSAGKCLFTGDEPASSGSPTQSSIEGTAAIQSRAKSAASTVVPVTPESVPVESLQSAPVRNHGRLRRHGVRGAPVALPVLPMQAPVAAAASPNVVASAAAWHAGGQHGAQPPRELQSPSTAMQAGVQAHMAAATPAFASQHADALSLLWQRAATAALPPQQRLAPVVLPQVRQAGPQQQLGLFEQPVHQVQLVQQLAAQEGLQPSEQMLDATLKYEQQVEAALRVENGQLRAELTQWRKAGARVADREAKVVYMITNMTRGVPGPHGEVPDQSTTLTDAPRQSLLSMVVEQYVFNEGKSPLEDTLNSRRLMLIFFVVNALAFLLWVLTARKGAGSRPRLLEAVLRRAGLGSYTMEVSELQVRNLCICGEAHLSMRMGLESEVRVEATESSEGDVVKFDGVFTFKVSASHPEGNCVCWVMDRDPLSEEERIAHLEVPIRDLLCLVQREHGEYVTFELEPHGPQAKRRLLGTHTAKPCIALRLRDVTMVPEHHKIMKSGSPSNLFVRNGSTSTLPTFKRLEDVAEPQ